MKHRLLSSRPRQAWHVIPLIRLMVGAVFLSEGLQKFIYPELRGAGRFAEIGFPDPAFWGTFVGTVEVVGGVLLLLGLLTRLAAIALIIDMTVAILITKITILFGHGLWIFNVRELDFYNFWSFAHEIRTDWAMWLGAIFLLIAGAGPWSLDAHLSPPAPPKPAHGRTERTGSARP